MTDWVQKQMERIQETETGQKGGPGSGNWGHAGRPGQRGGSAPGGGRGAGGTSSPSQNDLSSAAQTLENHPITRDRKFTTRFQGTTYSNQSIRSGDKTLRGKVTLVGRDSDREYGLAHSTTRELGESLMYNYWRGPQLGKHPWQPVSSWQR